MRSYGNGNCSESSLSPFDSFSVVDNKANYHSGANAFSSTPTHPAAHHKTLLIKYCYFNGFSFRHLIWQRTVVFHLFLPLRVNRDETDLNSRHFSDQQILNPPAGESYTENRQETRKKSFRNHTTLLWDAKTRQRKCYWKQPLFMCLSV